MTQQGEARGSLRLYAGIFLLGVLTGCAGVPASEDPSWQLVQVTDVSIVVGEWEGMVKKHDATFLEGSVRLMIRANSTFLFVGQTASKVAVGGGRIEIREGRMIADTERRAITFSLYERKGKSILFVQSTNRETGDQYEGEFTKDK
jgi:hypothetical protein